MRREEYLKLISVNNLKRSLKRTNRTIHAIEANIVGIEEFFRLLKAKEKRGYKNVAKNIILDKKEKSYIFELGFIALFSNFECFMVELVKELLNKYPSSYKSERLVSFEEIDEFRSVKQIKEYFIDNFAITKSSGDIYEWERFIVENYKIKIFLDKDHMEGLVTLNELRNLYLHSGARTNSKFRNKMKKLLKTPVPLNKALSFDTNKLFHACYSMMMALATLKDTRIKK